MPKPVQLIPLHFYLQMSRTCHHQYASCTADARFTVSFQHAKRVFRSLCF